MLQVPSSSFSLPSTFPQPPAEPNGIITNYTVRYKQESSQSFYQTVPLGSNSTHHYLSPLLQRASYQVEVAAGTSVGVGPYSEPITVSTDKSGIIILSFVEVLLFKSIRVLYSC